MEMKQCNIVFATDENYASATYVAIYSIAKYANTDVKYIIYVFISDLLNSEIETMFLSIERQFLNVEIRIKRTACSQYAYSKIKRISTATFLRLYAPMYLQVDKCLYLDQDILINGDVANIYDFQIGDNLIAGVEQPEYARRKMMEPLQRELLLEEDDRYINAGVMLMNLKEMRKLEWQCIIERLMKEQFPLGDQDIINVACRGRIVCMPISYNYGIMRGKTDLQPLIVHYAGAKKPWNSIYMFGADKWWQLCFETEVFDKFLKAECISFYLYYRMKNYLFESRENLYKFCEKTNNIIIYGAGRIAKRVVNDLKDKGLSIDGIVVSNKGGNPIEIAGVEVREIDFYYNDAEKFSVLLAVYNDVNTIPKELYKKGFKCVIPIEHLYLGELM